ncbi:MAG: serine/threonine protein kinase [Planctomycetaceae bacterium]|nr:serine/threonine protein kinase [Planctomycetaceae bacterium]
MKAIPQTLTIVALALLSQTIIGCGGKPIEEISASGGANATANVPAASINAGDWPGWRGPNGDGLAANETAPTKWSASENVAWKASIPGRGHASPTIVGDKVFVASAVDAEERQFVLCLDRKTGDKIWEKDVHRGKFVDKGHHKSTHASSTVASDGLNIFAAFLNDSAIWLTALDLDGEQLWQTRVGDFKAKFGYSASPIIHGSSVIVAGDNRGSGFLAAVNRKTGDIQWRKVRPSRATYASPAVVDVDGKSQIVIAGSDIVASYDPATGDEIWRVDGVTEACVGTVVRSGDLVVASGGYPGKETIAINAKSHDVAWRIKQKAYVPSMLAHDGFIYCVNDDGIAFCWDAKSGEEAWKKRVSGKFSASPTLIGENIYVISEAGKVTIFKASSSQYEVVNEIQLGDEGFASPVVAGRQLFLRVADSSGGSRQETLYCIAEPQSKPEAEKAEEAETGE